jgi:hypothetical protein
MRMPLTLTVPKWVREYFERGYAQRWDLPPVSDRVRMEIDRLWDQLELSPGAWLLDLGCGHGRHALAFIVAREVGKRRLDCIPVNEAQPDYPVDVRLPVSNRINLPRSVALNLPECGRSRIQFAI